MSRNNKIITQARTWLGTKYHHQGRLKKDDYHQGGVDCIGLIMGVAKELNLQSKTRKPLSDFDETAYSFYPDGISLPNFLDRHLIKLDSLKRIKCGDVILFKFFTLPQHVGIVSEVTYSNINKDASTNNNLNPFELNIIHCYSGSGRVVEHPLSPAWKKMIVSCYRFA